MTFAEAGWTYPVRYNIRNTMSSPVYGPTNPSPEEHARSQPRRFASIVELVPEKERYYRELHADVWQSVLKRIHDSNLRNYSIFLGELGGKKYLFSYCEYIGDDYEADMQAIADDPETRRWWKETDPCQKPLSGATKKDWWKDLEMVFHAD